MVSRVDPLWVCPLCGRTFRTANKNHSCGVFALADHFKGKDIRVSQVYQRLVDTLNTFGPVKVFPVKTRIVFQAGEGVQFAAAIPHKNWLEVIAWLAAPGAARHPHLARIEMHIFRDYGHIFRLERPEDLDEELAELLKEAYALSI